MKHPEKSDAIVEIRIGDDPTWRKALYYRDGQGRHVYTRFGTHVNDVTAWRKPEKGTAK